MSDQDVPSRLEHAVEIAREAGRLTLEWFNASSLEIDRKADGTPVTAADRAAERLLRERIAAAFPGDGVLGEEFGEQAGASGYRWILDPIDGTKSFCHGVPLYGTLVAVEDLRQRRAVAGVIVMPALGGETVYGADGLGAWHARGDGAPAPARVSAVASLREAMFCTTSLDYFTETGTAPVMAAMQRACGASRGWSDCYAHLLLATGRAEVVLEPKIAVWDVAPLQPILREAGGTYTDWRGEPTIYSPRGVATNGRVLDEVLRITRGAAGGE